MLARLALWVGLAILVVVLPAPHVEAGGGGGFSCSALAPPDDPCRHPGAPIYQPVRIENASGAGIAAILFDLRAGGTGLVGIDVNADRLPGMPPPSFQPDYWSLPTGATASFFHCTGVASDCFRSGPGIGGPLNQARMFGFRFTGFDSGEVFDFGMDADPLHPNPLVLLSNQLRLGPFDVDITVELEPTTGACIPFADPEGPSPACGPTMTVGPRWLWTDLDDQYIRRFWTEPHGYTLLVHVPNPGALWLLGLGAAGLGILGARRRGGK